MTPRSRARKAFTILGALTVAAVFVWFGSQVFIMSGTKATFTFVSVSATPAGGAGGPARTTTTTTITATTTAAGGR